MKISNHWKSPVTFWLLPSMSFDITPMVLLSPWYATGYCWNQGNPCEFPSPGILAEISLLRQIGFCWVLLTLYDELRTRCYRKCVDQNSFDERFPCGKPGLARLYMLTLWCPVSTKKSHILKQTCSFQLTNSS